MALPGTTIGRLRLPRACSSRLLGGPWTRKESGLLEGSGTHGSPRHDHREAPPPSGVLFTAFWGGLGQGRSLDSWKDPGLMGLPGTTIGRLRLPRACSSRLLGGPWTRKESGLLEGSGTHGSPRHDHREAPPPSGVLFTAFRGALDKEGVWTLGKIRDSWLSPARPSGGSASLGRALHGRRDPRRGCLPWGLLVPLPGGLPQIPGNPRRGPGSWPVPRRSRGL